MKLKIRSPTGIGVALHRAKAAILQKFYSCERRAEQNLERFPPTGFAESCAEPFGSMSEKADNRHSGQQAAFEQDEPRVEVANNGPLDLIQLCADDLVLAEERQSSRIVTKKENTLIGFKLGKGRADLFQVSLADLRPFGKLGLQG